MSYKIGAFLALALVVLAFPLEAALAGDGSVQGKVISKTTGEPVSGQLVLLHVSRSDGTALPNPETTTSPEGSFAFEDVDLAPGNQLALCATYQGAMYHDPFEAPSDGSPVSRDLAVYEATASDEAISLGAVHMIFYPDPKQRTVQVEEFLMFQNSGDRTYIGAGEEGKGNPGETLHFTLPEGASNLMLHQGLSNEEVQQHEGGFCSTAPMYPGQQNIVYTYVLPYSGKGTLRLQRPLDYRPAEVVVMTAGNQGQLTGQGIVSQGPVTLQGEEYKEYGVYQATLSPSQTALDLELSGLGGGAPGSAVGGNIKVLAGGATGLGLVGGLFFALVLKLRRATALAAAVTPRHPSRDMAEEEQDNDDPGQ
ncbi:MAG: hypothetical protein HYY00_00895 [Chloroflexi bacterium]|nr:hypothetical protein [Chloroflexota bacterium]